LLLLLFLLLLRSFAGAAGVAAALQSAAVAADAAVSAAVKHVAAVAAAAHLEYKEAPSPFVVLVPCSTSNISKQTLHTCAFQNVLSDDAGDSCLRAVDGTSETGMQLVQGLL
jgi:hypothetical protein